MKEHKKHPCRLWWIIAGVLIGAGLLIPTYFYVRLLPVLVGLVIGCYCLIFALEQKRPKAGSVLRSLLTGIVILGALIFLVTGTLILRAGSDIPDEDLPYIVVLGAQVADQGPSDSLQERIDTAYEYLSAHPDTVAIVSGGQGSDEPITEAQCMYDCLSAMGIPPERLIKEEQATSTWGNLTYSLDIIEAETGSRPTCLGVVSSEYHLFRTGLQAKEFGLQIIGIPARTGSFDRWLHYFVREIAGVWHYLLLGGQNR
jgi:uncharacterized SAM-binding protein YcdF (DUF218 family)